MNLSHRKATLEDLSKIIELLNDDELGKTREINNNLHEKYIDAFQKIDSNTNHYLMVIENNSEVIGTCHLTILPSLTFQGSSRLHIEAVRVTSKFRGQKMGEWMINQAIVFAKKNDCTIIQLTTNKERPQAQKFYEKIGFQSTHEGMKMYLNNT